jgi:Sec-independent protein secretion pathway component TatC
MAAPMILLYEFGIVICGFFEQKSRRTAEEAPAS